MRNPQRFEGLEEDKITWYSNAQKYTGNNEFGLEEGKITWYSNSCCYRSTRFGEEKATWYSNRIFLMCRWISSLEGWLQDSQTSTLRGCAGLMAWRGNRIAGFSNLLRRRKRRPRDWEGNRIAGCSNGSADVLTMFCGLEEDKIAGFSNDAQHRS